MQMPMYINKVFRSSDLVVFTSVLGSSLWLIERRHYFSVSLQILSFKTKQASKLRVADSEFINCISAVHVLEGLVCMPLTNLFIFYYFINFS